MITTIYTNPGQTISIVVQTLDGYSDGYVFQETATVTDGQTEFQLSRIPSSPESVLMYFNGLKQQYAIDYTVSGSTAIYLSSTPISADDVIEFIQVYNSSYGGDRINYSSPPAVMSVYFPDKSLAAGFPQNMTRLDTGLYVFDITIPSGSGYLGTFIVSTRHVETSAIQWNTFLINVARPFGNSSATAI